MFDVVGVEQQMGVVAEAAHVTNLGSLRGRRWFEQMRDVATVEERGRMVGRLPGFFEMYVE